MMQKIILSATALLLASCAQGVRVEVKNPSRYAREAATVEIAWEELRGVTPENAVVRNAAGEEIPSQVIYAGEAEPQSLIFQTDLEAGAEKHFAIAAGERGVYAARTYGRQVPERYDDYAWENDKVAYRLYGPALETSPEKLITPGIDVWVKSTDRLVIDERYARGQYHHDYGDGMDCYKVGVTLGSGASLPFAGGRFWMMGHNYATQRTLDNGPLRTTFELTYGPFEVEGKQVSLVKRISLDAGSRFSRMENRYTGVSELPIAAGVVRHDVKEFASGDGWLALREAASDSSDPAADGDIYLSILLPGAEILPDTLGHALAVKKALDGEPLVYYAGSGWSKGGVENMEQWTSLAAETAAALAEPLEVKVVR
ncbi:MAG: DUF4861 domain-containing protein [Alistipes sp.]|nr:DUF4861 domain-containing protein [Alistipes senegalensis]MCM1250126.1 DUF4861 domain-containing protein [Alistipes sp.]